MAVALNPFASRKVGLCLKADYLLCLVTYFFICTDRKDFVENVNKQIVIYVNFEVCKCSFSFHSAKSYFSTAVH